MSIRMLIVDDRAVVRKELRNILELTESVSVVGEAADGWEAIRLAKDLAPDIVLMDLEMPGLDGFEATRQIKNMHPAPIVIILSVYGDAAQQQKAFACGADGFLVKGADINTMLDLIQNFASRSKHAGQYDENRSQDR